MAYMTAKNGLTTTAEIEGNPFLLSRKILRTEVGMSRNRDEVGVVMIIHWYGQRAEERAQQQSRGDEGILSHWHDKGGGNTDLGIGEASVWCGEKLRVNPYNVCREQNVDTDSRDPGACKERNLDKRMLKAGRWGVLCLPFIPRLGTAEMTAHGLGRLGEKGRGNLVRE